MGTELQPTLTGERVRLRPFHEDDLESLWGMLNEPEGRRLTGTHQEFTREAAERWYRSRGDQGDRVDLIIADLHNDACVGEVVLSGIDRANRSCGFRIALSDPSVYGKGYGTEATRLILDHAFRELGLHRVTLQVYAFNTRARHVYEQVGFQVEGVLRDALLQEGAFHDALLMAILAHEWDPSLG